MSAAGANPKNVPNATPSLDNKDSKFVAPNSEQSAASQAAKKSGDFSLFVRNTSVTFSARDTDDIYPSYALLRQGGRGRLFNEATLHSKPAAFFQNFNPGTDQQNRSAAAPAAAPHKAPSL